jgi:hypothetical protein
MLLVTLSLFDFLTLTLRVGQPFLVVLLAFPGTADLPIGSWVPPFVQKLQTFNSKLQTFPVHP